MYFMFSKYSLNETSKLIKSKLTSKYCFKHIYFDCGLSIWPETSVLKRCKNNINFFFFNIIWIVSLFFDSSKNNLTLLNTHSDNISLEPSIPLKSCKSDSYAYTCIFWALTPIKYHIFKYKMY